MPQHLASTATPRAQQFHRASIPIVGQNVRHWNSTQVSWGMPDGSALQLHVEVFGTGSLIDQTYHTAGRQHL